MNILRLILCLIFVTLTAAFSSLRADDSTLWLAKSTDTSAKATIGSKTSTVPIKFDDGASWDCVKDSYSVSPSTASGIEEGKICVSVGSDGTATFKTKSSGKVVEKKK